MYMTASIFKKMNQSAILAYFN